MYSRRRKLTTIATDSPGGRHDGRKEEKVALVVVVLVVVKLRFDCGVELAVGVGAESDLVEHVVARAQRERFVMRYI